MKSRRGSSSASPTLISTLLRPSPPSLSHDVSQPRNLPCTRVLRISTPRAISGIRKLLARNSIGVHSNSRIPYPLPVHVRSRIELCVRRVERSVSGTDLSRRFYDYLWTNSCFYYVLPEGDRGESRGGNFEFGIGLCMGFELCWNYVFDLRIVQRDFWFDLINGNCMQ